MSEGRGITGRVVGPPLVDEDAAELDELARDERAEDRDARLADAGESDADGLAGFVDAEAAVPDAVPEETEDAFGDEETDDAFDDEEAEDAFGDEEAGEPFGDEESEEEEADTDSSPERWVLLRFVEVSLVLPATHPVLVLEEEDGTRQLRIPIGTPEGVAIAYAARELETARPLTHELVIDILEAYNLTIETVRITGVRGAAYEAEMVISGPSGMRTLPCRPSDGVALALRQGLTAPVVAAPAVMEAAGIFL